MLDRALHNGPKLQSFLEIELISLKDAQVQHKS